MPSARTTVLLMIWALVEPCLTTLAMPHEDARSPITTFESTRAVTVDASSDSSPSDTMIPERWNSPRTALPWIRNSAVVARTALARMPQPSDTPRELISFQKISPACAPVPPPNSTSMALENSVGAATRSRFW